MRPIEELNSLEEFKDAARRFHSAYYLANLGLSKLIETELSPESDRASGTYTLLDEPTNQLISKFPRPFLRNGIKRDGPISQVIAHGILSWIYTAWNDKYRKAIAEELGTSPQEVLCDVMGDLRILRNAIAHDLGTAGDKVSKLRELSWFKPGRLILTTTDMNRIQLKINNMKVYIRNKS